MKALIPIFFFTLNLVNAQITLKNETNSDNTISIYAQNETSGYYTVRIIYDNLVGYTTSLNEYSVALVGPGTSQIAKLSPQTNATSLSLGYKYTYCEGKALSKIPDLGFVYLLPSKVSKRLIVRKIHSLGKAIGQKEEGNLYALGFNFSKGDTICAARAGTVITLVDTISNGEKSSQSYSQQRNFISIEQKDGTIAKYTLLAPAHSLVDLGDRVIPGQSIAVFNKENEKYTVLFSVSYLDKKRFLAFNKNDNKKPDYFITLPTIWIFNDQQKGSLGSDISDQEIKAIHPVAIVAAELTKREKKKMSLE